MDYNSEPSEYIAIRIKLEAIRVVINMFHDSELEPPAELYKWRKELTKQRNAIESVDLED